MNQINAVAEWLTCGYGEPGDTVGTRFESPQITMPFQTPVKERTIAHMLPRPSINLNFSDIGQEHWGKEELHIPTLNKVKYSLLGTLNKLLKTVCLRYGRHMRKSVTQQTEAPGLLLPQRVSPTGAVLVPS